MTYVDFSIGPYYRTRARNPAEAEVGAGYSLSFEDSTKKTYTHTDTLEMNHEGYIMAYYFVPKFTVFQLDWYDFDRGKTDFYTQSIQISGAEFHKEVFTPYDGPADSIIPKPYLDPEVFPYHDAEDDFERLASYLIGDPIARAMVLLSTNSRFMVTG